MRQAFVVKWDDFESISQVELLEVIEHYNQDPLGMGFCAVTTAYIPMRMQSFLAIDPTKDVDGFHPLNMGTLMAEIPLMVPSTPAGIMEMFKEYGIDLEGKWAVDYRSNIVGKPMAAVARQNATGNLDPFPNPSSTKIARRADILVVAIGREICNSRLYSVVVIDVGMNRDENGNCVGMSILDLFPFGRHITRYQVRVGPMTVSRWWSRPTSSCSCL